MTRQWDFSLPTLCPSTKSFTKRVVLSSSAFKDALYHEIPWLAKINLSNFVLQGGAVIDIIMGKRLAQLNDLDLFVVGLGADDARTRVEQLLHDIVKAERGFIKERQEQKRQQEARGQVCRTSVPSMSDLVARRHGNSIAIESSCLGVKLSIGMTGFRNIAEGLYCTDIDASGICFDGEQVWCAPLCAHAIQNMSILVAPQLSRSCGEAVFERRLFKYFHQKGFDLILPNFDLACIRLPHRDYQLSEVIELPHFLLQVKNVSKKKIIVDNIFIKRSDPKAVGVFSGKNAFYTESDTIAKNVFAEAFYTNLRALVHDTDDFDFVAQGEGIHHVLFTSPRLTDRQIEVCYDTIQEQIFPSPEVFDATKITKYYSIPEATLSAFVHELFLRPGSETEQECVKRIRRWIREKTELQKRASSQKLAQLHAKCGQGKIDIRIGNLGKSLESGKAWYGHTFKPNDAMHLG